MDPLTRLAAHGLWLPSPPKPGGAYEPVRVLAGIAYVAAQFPFSDGTLAYRGRLGRDLTTDDGYRAAQLCALNVLSQVHHTVGLGNVALNRFEAYLLTVDDWDDFPRVVDGASHLFLTALGDAGRHARALFGVHRLPMNAPIELTATFTIRS